MYHDLNILWPARVIESTSTAANGASAAPGQSKKQKARGNNRHDINNNGGIDGAAAARAPVQRGVDLLNEQEKPELYKSVEMAVKFGYSTIAFNVVLPTKGVDVKALPDIDPCHGARPVFPEFDSRNNANSAATLQLSRLTVTLDETSIAGGKGNGSLFTSSNAHLLAGYNLIAVQPLDAASFSHVCLNLAAPGPSGVDIITVDLATSARLPFQLKRSLVLKAIADGAFFEICYAPALRAQPVPKDARRNVIAGARELIRITNGKGIILSSEVRRCFELRAPLDLCNLGAILGFKPDQAKAAIHANPRQAVIRGYADRSTYRGVISNPTVTAVIVRGLMPTQPEAALKAVDDTEPVQIPPPSTVLTKKAVSKRKRGLEDDDGR